MSTAPVIGPMLRRERTLSCRWPSGYGRAGRRRRPPMPPPAATASHDPTAVDARPAPSPDAGFAALYERHFRGIHDFAARMVRDRDLAADVVQATFARAWSSWQSGTHVDNER